MQKQSGGSSPENQGPSCNKRQAIWEILSRISNGKVATYGQIAKLAGLSGASRFVGAALKNLPENTKLPWHRVVNAKLEISRRDPDSMRLQKQRLIDEGIELEGFKINSRHRWRP